MPRKAKPAADKKGGAKAPPSSRPVVDIAAINKMVVKEFGDEAIPTVESLRNIPVISTGLLSLDHALGVGGWALGRLHSIEGPEHSGKTALALLGIAQIQREDPNAIVAFIDMEKTYSSSLAKLCGVDIDSKKLLIYQVPNAEDALLLVTKLLGYEDENGRWVRKYEAAVKAICYDSWAGSATETSGMAPLSRVGANWLPQISGMLAHTKTIFWMINQVRQKPGVMFGDPEYSPGGQTLKHAQTTRLWVHKRGPVEKDDSGRRTGHTMELKVDKNKLAPPFAKVYVDLNYVRGFDKISDAYACSQILGMDFHERVGGNKIVFDDIEANGEKAFFDELRTDPEAFDKFMEVVRRGIEAQRETAVRVPTVVAEDGDVPEPQGDD